MPISDMELKSIRENTPGCRQVIHFNNAGASLMSLNVLGIMNEYLMLEGQVGGYEAAEMKAFEIQNVYQSIVDLINAQSEDEIALIENATRAWDMAFYSIPFQRGETILTTNSSYASNYIAFLQMAERYDLTIKVIPDEESGEVSISQLQNMLDDKVRVVAITHMPTNGGVVQPIEEIGKFVKQSNAYYLVDACQSVGQYPIDVQKINCDMLSATSRKYIRGPRGAGFLYVRQDVIETLVPPLLDLHAARWISSDQFEIRKDAKRFENWERNYTNIIGFGEAIRYIQEIGIERIWNRVQSLAAYLREKLKEDRRFRVADYGLVQSGIVTYSIQNADHQEIRERLQKQRINVSISQKASTRLDMEKRGLESLIRASVHYYNTTQEVDRFINTQFEVL